MAHSYTHVEHKLACGSCGEVGRLSMTVDIEAPDDWSFGTVGFVALGVDRYHLPNSLLRCGQCGSHNVKVES